MQIVTLTPAHPGQPVADSLAAAALPLPLPCGGRKRCGNCIVWLRGALSPVEADETALLQTHPRPGEAPGAGFALRLACCCRLLGAAECALPEAAAQPATAEATAAVATAPLPGYDGTQPGSLGVAVDVGTTTITLELFCFPSAIPIATVSEMNRQGAFGADVLSRIAAVALQGLAPLTDCLRAQLSAMLAAALGQAQASSDAVTRLCITGNTTMLHFLAGLDPTSMGASPFTPQSLFGAESPANAVFPALPAGAALYLPPCVSAFIGADITCGALASDLCGAERTLMADVGTNGEMMLHTKDGALLCCSTAAGPAFEGAEITMGMPALPGAVDRVWGECGQLRWHAIPGAEPKGICGTGLISALRFFLEHGTLDETGCIEPQEDDPYLLWQEDGASLWLGGSDVVVTQRDVRKLQLVKASIAAGIETLLHESGIASAALHKLWLGGGFGSYLRPDDAAAIGMIPPAAAPMAQPAGNIALRGAEMLLFSHALRAEALCLAQRAVEISLATHPVFGEAFIEGMGF
ncbi:MAG: ASKHA domain-containing protein [Oscillospiraceae bacterium]|jgi:uncharacterized 2Fe-2S/4Fe-4S cluster protein (DUF4445 family)|nr:ASKHA domain-containing protein [Oscillospiraceae bacterium]